MKREVADYVAKCITCQKIKVEHQKLGDKLQPLEVPKWEWDQISEISSKCTSRIQVIKLYLSTDIVPIRIKLLNIKINYLNYYLINRKIDELQ